MNIENPCYKSFLKRINSIYSGIMEKYKNSLSIDSVMTTYVIVMGLFFCGCENTIIDNSIVNGCTETYACNYDGNAKENDGSCEYSDVCDVCGGYASTCNYNGVVINEINYNSSDGFNTGDWVELYNSSDSQIDIGNWKLRDNDNDNEYTIPENTILSSDAFIVFCKNKSVFTILFDEVEVTKVIGDLGFFFSSEGDQVRLFDDSYTIVDYVEYSNSDPWPTESNGEGPTLELIHPSQNNNAVENWAASNANNGTPGEINSVYNDE